VGDAVVTPEEFKKRAREDAEKYAQQNTYVDSRYTAKRGWIVGAFFGFDQGVAAVLEMLRSLPINNFAFDSAHKGKIPTPDDCADWIESKLAERLSSGGAKE
jgi:hypothetical protein